MDVQTRVKGQGCPELALEIKEIIMHLVHTYMNDFGPDRYKI